VRAIRGTLRIVGSILLVESDPETRDRLGQALREAGHEVLVAASAKESFLRASEGGLDAIVIDSYDPRVGVVELVRSMNTLPDTPPVVLVSASPHAPEISARIGAAAFVPKPFELTELVGLLGRVTGEVRPVRVFDDANDERSEAAGGAGDGAPRGIDDAAVVEDFAGEPPTSRVRLIS
jgi:two-component system, NtrC family, nitrogen regulation response regulator GlnG